MTGTAAQIIRWLLDKPADQTFEVVRKRKKRSLDANGLYWALVTEMANAMRLPKAEVHNRMLRRYGQPYGIGGRLVTTAIPDTEEAERQAVLSETLHMRPTSQVRLGTKGQMFRTYVMLRGSSDYDSREMAILIDGTIEEAKQLGIDTEEWTALLKQQNHAISAAQNTGWKSIT